MAVQPETAQAQPNADPSTDDLRAKYGFPSDRELADRVLKACAELQEAMDNAVLAGLVLEPSFTRIEDRITRGAQKFSTYLCNVKVFRKL